MPIDIPNSTLTALVVCDARNARQVCEEIRLAEPGWNTLTAQTASEAVLCAGQMHPQVILVEDSQACELWKSLQLGEHLRIGAAIVLLQNAQAARPNASHGTPCLGRVSLPARADALQPLLHAAEQIGASEQRYWQLFDTASEGLILLRDGIVWACNPPAEAIFASSKAEMTGKPIAALLPEFQPDGLRTEDWLAEIFAMVKPGQPQTCECVCGLPGGNRIMAEAFIRAVKLGGKDFLQVMLHDLSPERKTEISHQTAAAAFQLNECSSETELLSLAGEFAHRLNPHSYIVMTLYDHEKQVHRIYQALGFGSALDTIKETLGFDLFDFTFADDMLTEKEMLVYTSNRLEHLQHGIEALLLSSVPEPVCQGLERALDVEHVYCQGFEVQGRPRGSLVMMTKTGHPLVGRHSIEMIVNHAAEMIKRWQAERAQRDSLQRYRHFFDQPLIGMNIKNAEGKFIEINDHYCEFLGYSREELMELTWKDITHPDDIAAEGDPLEQLSRAEVNGYEIEKRFIRKDGRVVWGRVAVRASRQADGSLGAMFSFISDITARREAEQRINRLLEQQIAINRLTLALGEAKDKRSIYHTIYEHVKAVMVTDAFVLSLYDPEARLIRAEYMVVDGTDLDVAPIPPLPLSQTASGTQSRVIHSGQPLYVPDYPHANIVVKNRYRISKEGEMVRVKHDSPPPKQVVQSMLLVPMKKAGEIIGVMQAQSYELDSYTQEDMDLLAGLANVAAIAVQNATLAAELRQELSERIRTETALRKSEQRYRDLFNSVPIGLYRTNINGEILDINPALLEIMGLPANTDPADISAADVYLQPDVRQYWLQLINESMEASRIEMQWRKKDGRLIWVQENSKAVRDEQNRVIAYEGSVDDITERKLAAERVQRNFQRLEALRQIDMAITSSIDLRIVLKVLLNQVVWQLSANAARVLIYAPEAQTLRHAAEIGLHTGSESGHSLRMGEGLAGKAGLERRIVYWSDESMTLSSDLMRSLILAESAPEYAQGFAACFAAPLVAKGQVVGVLELFHRANFVPDEEWIDFLELLCGQAAIAITSAAMFEELQVTNTELRMAYDTTLEGWSHALDMRDAMTEGHSRRVTELTVMLASSMGVRNEALVHIRRGALLHDIGKIAVPDKVLSKTGPLDPDEWEVMKQHPQNAYDMLAPIPYLKPALAIPYYHHERWDGTGYPHGLKGSEIPLEARIFALVDAWDALRHARPYRKAWTQEEALEYIADQAGRAFDPEVVRVFQRLIAERSSDSIQ